MSATEIRKGPEERFTDYLQKMVEREDRAPLASLRRGLGKQPGEAAEAFRFVMPMVPPNTSSRDEDLYFLIGTLFALHQVSWPASDGSAASTNFGASFARLNRELDSDSVEKRFVALLNCHQDDLQTHLRHAVSLLKSKEVPVDWPRLLRDLRGWTHDDRYVQRRWARAFWAEIKPVETSDANRVAD